MDEVRSAKEKGVDEKYCESCGEIIKIRAVICPKCGVKIRKSFSKTALLLTTFFLGGIGGHKFYIGKIWPGVFYLLFCWTGIPGIIAFVEFIIYAVTDEEKLHEKYSSGNPNAVAVLAALGIGAIFIFGILAALAIPKFTEATAKAKMSEVPTVLTTYLNAQLAHIAETDSIGELNEILFDIPSSKWFDYYESNVGTFCAQAKESVGTFPKGGTITLSVDGNGNVSYSFSDTCEWAAKKYMPRFFE